MKARFALKFAFFMLPFALYFVPTVGIALFIGGFMPLRQVIEMQMGEAPVLYGPAYWEDQFAYKLLAMKRRRPEIVIVGSSRVMQWRSEFISKRPNTFYNVGGAVRSFQELEAFVNALESNEFPKIILIGLDQHWLNLNFTRVTWATDSWLDENIGGLNLRRALDTSGRMFSDYLQGNIRPSALFLRQDPLLGATALGLGAVMNGDGFRNDGSRQVGIPYVGNSNHVQTELSEQLTFLQLTNPLFLQGNNIDEENLVVLERILQQLKSQNVFVIGFSPPFVSAIYGEMIQEGTYNYLNDAVTALEKLFESYSFAYFDFTDGSKLGANWTNMLDAFHSSEYISLVSYIQILQELPTVLDDYSDLDVLKKISSDVKDPVRVFD